MSAALATAREQTARIARLNDLARRAMGGHRVDGTPNNAKGEQTGFGVSQAGFEAWGSVPAIVYLLASAGIYDAFRKQSEGSVSSAS